MAMNGFNLLMIQHWDGKGKNVNREWKESECRKMVRVCREQEEHF